MQVLDSFSNHAIKDGSPRFKGAVWAEAPSEGAMETSLKRFRGKSHTFYGLPKSLAIPLEGVIDAELR
jgi:hypothetical protein